MNSCCIVKQQASRRSQLHTNVKMNDGDQKTSNSDTYGESVMLCFCVCFWSLHLLTDLINFEIIKSDDVRETYFGNSTNVCCITWRQIVLLQFGCILLNYWLAIPYQKPIMLLWGRFYVRFRVQRLVTDLMSKMNQSTESIAIDIAKNHFALWLTG